MTPESGMPKIVSGTIMNTASINNKTDAIAAAMDPVTKVTTAAIVPVTSVTTAVIDPTAIVPIVMIIPATNVKNDTTARVINRIVI